MLELGINRPTAPVELHAALSAIGALHTLHALHAVGTWSAKHAVGCTSYALYALHAPGTKITGVAVRNHTGLARSAGTLGALHWFEQFLQSLYPLVQICNIDLKILRGLISHWFSSLTRWDLWEP
jgi:hypothetical protein